jgi:hypothetical protein
MIRIKGFSGWGKVKELFPLFYFNRQNSKALIIRQENRNGVYLNQEE